MTNPMFDRLDVALQDAKDWHDVERRLREMTPAEEVLEARPLVWAFGYMLIEPRSEEKRQVAGSPFGPMIAWENAQFPPRVEDIEPNTLDAWEQYAGVTTDPVALARFHDLLWVRRHGDAHLHARVAIDAYLALAVGSWVPIQRAFSAVRALELARELNDPDLISQSAATCRALADADLTTEEWSPGVALRLLESLVALPGELQPSGLRAAVESCGDRYGSDPWIAQSLTDLLAALTPADDREHLWRAQVQQWREFAQDASGLTRYAHRQHALQRALSHGLTDLADEIRRDLQETSEEDLDFKEISATVDVPADEIDSIVESVAQVGDWRKALQIIGAQGPPTGNVKANEEAVRRSAQDFPLTWLFGTQVVGPHRALVLHADTEEKKFRLKLMEQEGYGVALFAPVLARMLDRFVDHFGIPSEDDLTGFLEHSFTDATLARSLAQAVGYYWRGEHDAAGHLLAPRLEAAIRQLCVALRIPVTKLPRGDTPGGVVTLGLLLNRLEGWLDESWRHYLVHVLADPLGTNIRNDVGHGLIDRVDQLRAALLVHVLLFLRRLDIED